MPAAAGKAQWSSRFAFVMAAVGSSVGLGNLWRFSSEAGENGGGAFILIYLLAVVLVCIPVLMSEYLVGRAGSSANAVDSVAEVAIQSKVTKNWTFLSWVGMIAGFLIVTFYCVVAAWVMRYIFKFLSNDFAGLEADQVADVFVNFIGTPIQVLPWFLLFALITIYLVSRGVNEGIELAAITHPNDLYEGDAAQFQLLLNGEPYVGAEIELVAGGTRYRDAMGAVNLTTDENGQFSYTWPEAGMYWFEVGHEIEGKAGEPSTSYGYAVTLEVLPL